LKVQATHPPRNGRFAALLEAIPEAAMLLGADRLILATNEHFRTVFADGQEVAGRPCYDVSHCRDAPCEGRSELCPLQRCCETGDAVHTLHVHSTAEGEVHTAVLMRPLFEEAGEIGSFLEILRPLRIASATASRDRLVGRSPLFNRMLEDLDLVGPTEKPVAIFGEAGTGKELVARALHEISPRRHRSFVPVDCPALHEWQFERELFGHSRGAFPGANEARTGFVAAADGGTLFLKEIDSLSSGVQVKLLRLLETGFYVPEGATQPLRSEFRLICSSTRSLDDLATSGRFRDDLRHLIGGFPIAVPPLRDRVEDIPLLVESLLNRLEQLQPCPKVDPSTLETLQAYDFPGNVRELVHILEHACLIAEGGVILPEHLPDKCRESLGPPRPQLQFEGDIVPLSEAEELYIIWASQRSSGSQRVLARRLGVSERTLYRKLRKARRGRAGAPPDAGDTDSQLH
jgi:two-component system response regulator HydG